MLLLFLLTDMAMTSNYICQSIDTMSPLQETSTSMQVDGQLLHQWLVLYMHYEHNIFWDWLLVVGYPKVTCLCTNEELNL